MQIEDMPMVRVFFSKTGRAKYTSHLDTVRTLSRAFKRSGLPVWYTQGFNPHIYMNFALPIALGYESKAESVDVRLTREVPFDTVVEKLNHALPPGLEAIRAAAPEKTASSITWADYDVRLVYEDVSIQEVKQRFDAFWAQPVIETQKKTKKGEKTIDLKPLSQVLSAECAENVLLLKLRMASGITENVNPTLFLKAFYTWANVQPDGVKIIRTAILDEKLKDFA